MNNIIKAVELIKELETERDKWRDLVNKREETLGLLRYYDQEIHFSKNKQHQLQRKIEILLGGGNHDPLDKYYRKEMGLDNETI